MIYTLTLNPAIDYLMRTGKLTPGATNRSECEETRFGGKGLNVSRVLGALGVPSVALGFAGVAFRQALEESFAGTAVTPAFTPLAGGMRINVKLLGETETEINGAGPEVAEAEAAALLDSLDALAPGDVLAVSGSLPRGLGAEFLTRVFDRARRRGADIAADLAGDALRAALPFAPLLVKPNRAELEGLFGADAADVPACADELAALGARGVLITLGADGAYALGPDGERGFIPALAKRACDAVGAGDAAVAGFLRGARTVEGGFTEGVVYASACSAAAVSEPGLPDAERVAAFLPQARELAPLLARR